MSILNNKFFVDAQLTAGVVYATGQFVEFVGSSNEYDNVSSLIAVIYKFDLATPHERVLSLYDMGDGGVYFFDTLEELIHACEQIKAKQPIEKKKKQFLLSELLPPVDNILEGPKN